MKRSVSMILSLLLGVLLVGPLAAAPAAASPDCSETAAWGSASQIVDSRPAGLMRDLRAGRQECYDRLVVDLDGPAPGYVVEYVPQVVYDGSGIPVPLRGTADLLVYLRTAAHDGDYNPTYDPPVPHEAVDVTGFETFRQVAFLGTFEGETTLGLGVRERLPFRVLSLEGPGSGGRLVIDVAHSWQGQGSPSASPFGNYESAAGVEGGVEVKGWTIDPDRTQPIYVWVTVDGAGRHLYANGDRPDVGAVYPAYGPGHGFRGVVPASPGSQVVCVTASNVGLGGHTPLGCRTVSVPSGSPFGNFESATGVAGGVEIKGWTVDPSAPTTALYAWVTIDGVGRHVLADKSRPDVGAALPGYGPNHGFRDTLPAAAGSRRVCVTAANVGPGSHTSLGCRTVTVPSASPFGNYESAAAVVGGIEVKGWMADPSAPTTPLYAWVTVDGIGRHLYANRTRSDVAAAYPAYGPDHGFRGTIPAGPGTHQVCVTAANVGPGSHTPLGCRTVALTAVDVYFQHEDRFVAGTEPYTEAVERTVSAASPAAGALEALFAGPTTAEQAQSLRVVLSEATGFADLSISGGIARVRLTGGCNSQGATFTVYNLIEPTLKQFATVDYVKVYSPGGETAEPDGPSDSIPACLEP